MSSTADPPTQIIRWLARLIGASLGGLVISIAVIALFDGHRRVTPDDLLTIQGIMTVDLWAIILVGLLVAFVWEGLGGAGIVLAALAMQTYSLTRQPQRFDPLDALFAFVGLAFLVCWWRTRQLHLDVTALKPHAQQLRLDNATPRPTRLMPFAAHRSPTMSQEKIPASDRRGEPAHLVAGWLPPWTHRVDLDVVRARMECGPGGDVDADGSLTRRGACYVPGLKRTVSAWVRLHERVQRGDLGGVDDGQAQAGGSAHRTK